LADIRNISGVNSQMVPHETVEMGIVGVLAKAEFHRSPELFVEPGLQCWLQTHKNEVSNQICLAQLSAGGIHALENELRIVLIPAEGNIYHNQFRQPFAD